MGGGRWDKDERRRQGQGWEWQGDKVFCVEEGKGAERVTLMECVRQKHTWMMTSRVLADAYRSVI